MNDIERLPSFSPIEARSADSGEYRIGGRAITYGRKSRPLGHFIEVIENRAWAQSIADKFAGVISRLEHDPRSLLASVDSNTMWVTATQQGLDYEILLPATQAGRDCWELVESRRIRGSSVSMAVKQDQFSYEGGDLPIRHILAATLIECSPTAIPAYSDATDVYAIRSLAAQLGEDPTEVEQIVKAGNARTLFKRTDVPTPLEVAQRRDTSGVDPELLRRRLLNRAANPDDPIKPRTTEPSLAQRILDLHCRKMMWDMPVVPKQDFGPQPTAVKTVARQRLAVSAAIVQRDAQRDAEAQAVAAQRAMRARAVALTREREMAT